MNALKNYFKLILASLCVGIIAVPVFLATLATYQATADQGSLCMPTSGTVSGLTFSQNVNAALQAIITANSGATEPTNSCTGVPQGGQFWMDTSGTFPALKLYDGTAWQTIGTIDTSTNIWTPVIGGGATTLASAATTDLWSVSQNYVTVTGTTTITALATSAAVLGTQKTVTFSDTLTLTYDATQMILPGGLDIVTAPGDVAQVVSLGSDNVAVINYTRASGQAINPAAPGQVGQFLADCPAQWISPNGGTIGSASSGASNRANADTAQLFAAMWALDATVSPIFTSAGSASTRGANAAADFAANKRITVPDLRARFLRGLDDGRGIDTSRLLGSTQTEMIGPHSHSATASTTGAHIHSYTITAGSYYGANSGGVKVAWSAGDSFAGNAALGANVDSNGNHTHTITVDNNSGTENRPANVAVRECIKL